MKNVIRTAALCLMLVPSVGDAQDLDKGYGAYGSGDYATSFKEFKPLAEQGNADAQGMLGSMYENGKGVPQDYAEAAKWYARASEQGDAIAQYDLGRMYEYGQGVLQDYAEAVRFYKKAAGQGFAPAQNNLGVKYSYGEGVPLDYITAHMWYNLASVNGEESAVKNRDFVATKMTPADISEAQRRASVCMSSGYSDCD
jgi:TPR repeat protein